jgi:Asp-tRNA(Asn)/Glu-tRNA(Gln) amidotransferase A subunit family amidase
MRERLDAVAVRLAAEGARVEPVRLPAIVPALLAAARIVMWAEAAAVHADLHGRYAARYRPRIRAGIETGACIPASLYLRAQQIRRQARLELRPVLDRLDAILMPSAPGPAPDPSTTGDPSFNAPWSAIGAPAISVPMGLDPDGLPLGLQLVGAPFAETRLLEATAWVEAVVGLGAAPPDRLP